MSTDPRQQYLKYLVTSQLVDCLVNIDERLIDRVTNRSAEQKELLRAIRSDILAELRSRQLTLDDLMAD